MDKTSLFERNFAFRSAFLVLFESTTKHGRKAQIVKIKGTISNLNRLLQSFSKSAHEKYCKIRDFRGRGERQ